MTGHSGFVNRSYFIHWRNIIKRVRLQGSAGFSVLGGFSRSWISSKIFRVRWSLECSRSFRAASRRRPRLKPRRHYCCGRHTGLRSVHRERFAESPVENMLGMSESTNAVPIAIGAAPALPTSRRTLPLGEIARFDKGKPIGTRLKIRGRFVFNVPCFFLFRPKLLREESARMFAASVFLQTVFST